jgi:1-deoxy-D-xylulose-5-phosphate synthase
MKHLVETFNNIKRFREPVLIHTITKKGKGYKPAEDNPSRFHGVGPFEVATGKVKPSEGPPSYTAVFGETMMKLAKKDPRLVAITAAMEYGTGLAEFAQAHPHRFFDVGIAEQHGVVFAAGMAREGYRPVVAVYSTFMQRGYDHLVHDVCMQNFPVIFAMDRSGIVGEDGPTHHGVFDMAFCRHIPNLVMMAPSDEQELADMLATALTIEGPSAMRYPRSAGLGVLSKRDPAVLPIGRGRMLREGSDILIIAVGSMAHPALQAAEILALEGVSAAVMDPRFIKPLDRDLIVSKAGACGRVLTVEEGVVTGGFGSAVVELLSEEGLQQVKCVRLGIDDSFVGHGSRSELLLEAGLTPEKIALAAREALERESGQNIRCIASARTRGK